MKKWAWTRAIGWKMMHQRDNHTETLPTYIIMAII